MVWTHPRPGSLGGPQGLLMLQGGMSLGFASQRSDYLLSFTGILLSLRLSFPQPTRPWDRALTPQIKEFYIHLSPWRYPPHRVLPTPWHPTQTLPIFVVLEVLVTLHFLLLLHPFFHF